VVWSRASTEKAWVIDEASRARSLGTPVVPIRIDPVDLPLGFGDLHTFDLIEWARDPNDPEFIRLKGTLTRIAEARVTVTSEVRTDATQRRSATATAANRTRETPRRTRVTGPSQRALLAWLVL
jgi:hypothetical protein